jgi:hypothetical protein
LTNAVDALIEGRRIAVLLMDTVLFAPFRPPSA